jgi:hypothetical protein
MYVECWGNAEARFSGKIAGSMYVVAIGCDFKRFERATR